MTLKELLDVNYINSVAIFIPDCQFPGSFSMAKEEHFTCAAREVLSDRPRLCRQEVDAIYLSPTNMLQIVLKPDKEKVEAYKKE